MSGAPGLDRRRLLLLAPAGVLAAGLAGVAGWMLTRDEAPELAGRIERLLTDRPLAVEAPAPGLTALTNRLVGYLEG